MIRHQTDDGTSWPGLWPFHKHLILPEEGTQKLIDKV